MVEYGGRAEEARRALLYDPQTSGGLLLLVPEPETAALIGEARGRARRGTRAQRRPAAHRRALLRPRHFDPFSRRVVFCRAFLVRRPLPLRALHKVLEHEGQTVTRSTGALARRYARALLEVAAAKGQTTPLELRDELRGFASELEAARRPAPGAGTARRSGRRPNASS